MTFISLIPDLYINVKQFGAMGDGVTDDTVAINLAISYAVSIGAAGIFFPAGTYIHTGIIIYNFLHYKGAGYSITILQLKNGANADCIQGLNAPSLIGTNNVGGVANFMISDMTIDGNKANQSSTSYGIRVYGYGYTLMNVRVRNTFSDALRSDWNGGATVSATNTDSMEASIINCKFHDTGTGAMGVNFTGPHDSQFVNVISYKTGSHNFYFGPNTGGTQCVNCHGWGVTLDVGAVAWLIESIIVCVNCEGEGSDAMQVVMLANNSTWVGGRIFSGGVVVDSAANNTNGLQLGQLATVTLASGAVASPITLTTAPTLVTPLGAFLQFVISGAGGSGTISIVGTDYTDTARSETLNPTGNGTFTSTFSYESTSSITWTGLSGASINVVGLGVPYPGSSFQSGGVTTNVSLQGCNIDSQYISCEGPLGAIWFARDTGQNRISGIATLSGSNTSLVTVGAVNGSTQLNVIPRGGVTADGTSGKGGKVIMSVDAFNAVTIRNATSGNDNFNYNTHASPPRSEWVNGAIIRLYSDNYSTRTIELSGGTISVLHSSTTPDPGNNGTITTSGVGMARVTPTANETGIILQAGTLDGQHVVVVNNSASFSITFAVSGTSHVAGGTGVVIAANAKQLFIWDSVASLWY